MKKNVLIISLCLLLSVIAMTCLFGQELNEGFESEAAPPAGWTMRYANENPPDGNLMIHDDNVAHQGERSFRFSSFASGAPYDQYLITPRLQTSEDDRTISFYYRRHTWGNETFRVGWSTTGTDLDDFQWSEDITNATAEWQQYVKDDLPIGESVYVCIHYKSVFAYYLYIDTVEGPEIYIPEEPPTAAVNPDPSDEAEDVAIDVHLSWEPGDAFTDSYDVYFGEQLPAEPNAANHDTTSFDPGELDYDTTYRWKIVPRNQFGANEDVPTWSFTTAGGPTVTEFPWTESFTGEQFPPIHWEHEFVSGEISWIRAAGGHNNNPAGAVEDGFNARFYAGGARGAASRLITPPLDVSELSPPQLSFWHAQRVWAGDQDTLRVYYSEIDSDELHLIASFEDDIPEWTERDYVLSDDLGTIQIIFEGIGDFGYGVVLDVIDVREAPAAPAPRDLAVTNITGNSAYLGWEEAGDAEAWDIELGLAGFEPTGNPTRENVNTNPYRYENLSPSTSYEFYVRSNYGDDLVSDWAGPRGFATSQIPATLPFTEVFDEDIQWQIANGEQTNQWHIGDVTSYYGERSAFISNDGGDTNAYTITSASTVHIYRDIEFPEDADNVIELSFMWKGMGENNFDYLAVYMVDTDVIPTAGAFVPQGQIGERYSFSEEWRRELFEFNPEDLAGETKRLVFTWRNDASMGTQPPVAVDSIHIAVAEGYPEPRELTAVNITGNSADLGWTEIGGADEWDIELGLSGFEPTGNPTERGVTDNPFTYQELNPMTAYDFYVRAVHGDDEYSDWAGPKMFMTSQIPAELPFTEDFEDDIDWQIVNGEEPNIWFIGDVTAYQGERAAFITNDDGQSNSYDINSSSVVHIYRDIEFPEDTGNDFELEFYWKGMGEGSQWADYDYMRVFLVDTDVIPQAGTQLFTGQIGETYNMEEEWQRERLELANDDYAGEVRRLIFTWRNDSSVGTQPPVAIDKISVAELDADPNPTIAVNPAPADSATGVPVSLENLEWRYISDDDYTDPVGFRVYITSDDDFGEQYDWVDFQEQETDYHLDVPVELEHETTYFWKVVPTTTYGGDGRSSATGSRRRSDTSLQRTNLTFRGDAENVPVWRFTTDLSGTYTGTVNPTGDAYEPYIADINGVEIIFVPAGGEDQMINITVTVSGNPDYEPVTLFSRPDALGRYFGFLVDNGTVFRRGNYLRLNFENRPNQLWYRLGSGNWAQIDFEWDDGFAVVDLSDLGDARRNDLFEFAGDNGQEGQTLPVELSSFTAGTTAEMSVVLNWTSETETNMLGYNVYKNDENSYADALMINRAVISAHNTSETMNYRFEDDDVDTGKTYYYWLQSVDLDLTYGLHGPVSVTIEEEEELPPVVYDTELFNNYPNPFNPNTTITFSLREDADVSLKVFNISGQIVRTLFEGQETKGKHTIIWDGLDDNGRVCTSGIYFYRLQTDHYNETKKMILVK